MKNPNGYGTVAKLSGNRRNPFVVKKTLGFNDKGHPISQVIGYYPTREEGMIALAQFNANPYDIDAGKITMVELYQKWLELKAPKLGSSNLGSLKSACKHCESLHGMKYKDIRAYHMQAVIDGCNRGSSTQAAIRSLFIHLDNLGLELDVATKLYGRLLTSDPAPESTKEPFTDEEIERLWDMSGQPWVDSVIILLYSGWRIEELLSLKCSDIDIEAGTMKGGLKTKAGKGRIVPIHSRTSEFIRTRLQTGGEYVFSRDGAKLTYMKYHKHWNQVMNDADMSHTPHECRHTFRSRLDSAGANKSAMDKLMGHSSGGTGEKVYTHKTIEELRAAIELL
ncbi:MAG: site-specific integrase [Clostridiales bacterium]|jgi:site-specific recombinase XerD|nr:site-specific integrase [Clostridiales bacterium]